MEKKVVLSDLESVTSCATELSHRGRNFRREQDDMI
jgi:hypothetical protein